MSVLIIENVLSPELVDQVTNLLSDADWQDGAKTAVGATKRSKKNKQAEFSPRIGEAQQLVYSALLRSDVFQKHVLPARITWPIFNRYDVGDFYKEHFDHPLMGRPEPLRADVSVTVTLAREPGGDGILRIGGESYSTPNGWAIVYPTTELHEVTPVTEGTRLAAVLWAQSHVRDAAQREILLDLARAFDVASKALPESREILALGQARANLLRQWMD